VPAFLPVPKFGPNRAHFGHGKYRSRADLRPLPDQAFGCTRDTIPWIDIARGLPRRRLSKAGFGDAQAQPARDRSSVGTYLIVIEALRRALRTATFRLFRTTIPVNILSAS
jgi:hypothetical protein